MKQIHFKLYGTGEHIKDWPNWSGEVPQKGDLVELHFGDDNEEVHGYIVKLRVISGTQPEHIRIFIEPIKKD